MTQFFPITIVFLYIVFTKALYLFPLSFQPVVTKSWMIIKKCLSCLTIITEPLTWAHCELLFKLPTCMSCLTVWKNDIMMLFNIEYIETYNSDALEDAIPHPIATCRKGSWQTPTALWQIIKDCAKKSCGRVWQWWSDINTKTYT